jgi:hypothetical protein
MNRISLLLLAAALALPLAAAAQTGANVDPAVAADTAGTAAPQAAVGATSAAAAAPDIDDDRAFQQWDTAERERIADGRAIAHARYEQDRRECWQRFAVNACLDRAREHRRAVLDALRHDELALNAQERNRRTAARLDQIAHKQASNAERSSSDTTRKAPASSAQTQ